MRTRGRRRGTRTCRPPTCTHGVLTGTTCIRRGEACAREADVEALERAARRLVDHDPHDDHRDDPDDRHDACASAQRTPTVTRLHGGDPPRAIHPQRAKPTPQLCGTGPRPPTSHRYPRPAGCGGPWMPAVPRQQKWRLPRQQRPRLLPAGSISSHRVSHDPAGPRRAALPFAFGSISRISAVGASGTRRKWDSAQAGLALPVELALGALGALHARVPVGALEPAAACRHTASGNSRAGSLLALFFFFGGVARLVGPIGVPRLTRQPRQLRRSEPRGCAVRRRGTPRPERRVLAALPLGPSPALARVPLASSAPMQRPAAHCMKIAGASGIVSCAPLTSLQPRPHAGATSPVATATLIAALQRNGLRPRE
jgi:hypothetical protein